jgi:hypothetical protein
MSARLSALPLPSPGFLIALRQWRGALTRTLELLPRVRIIGNAALDHKRFRKVLQRPPFLWACSTCHLAPLQVLAASAPRRTSRERKRPATRSSPNGRRNLTLQHPW